MLEKPVANTDIAAEQAQEDTNNLKFFLESTFTPDGIEDLNPSSKRVAVETILLFQMADHTPLSKEFGLPESSPELADMRQDPSKVFNKAVKRGKGRRETYSRMDGFREDALKESRALNRVTTLSDDGAVILDVSKFRKDREAIYAVGDYLHAREFATNTKWPARNTNEFKNGQKYWRGCVLAAAKVAGASILAPVAEDARENAQNRLRYWTDQIQKIGRTVGGKAVRTALAESESAEPRHDQTSQLDAAEDREETVSYDFRPPPEVQKYLDERRAEFEAEFDRLDSMGMPEGEKQRILAQKYPEIMLPDRESQEARENRKARERATAAGGTHAKGPRGKKHIFDDNSESVKSEYEGYGK